MRISILLQPSEDDPSIPRVNPVTGEVIARLRERGARVDMTLPESEPLRVADVRPGHDLYVLKSKTPLSLGLAGVLTLAGARVVNGFRASSLARDKIATTSILAAAGVPQPPSWATGRSAALLPLLADGPLWVKPPRGSKGRGVRRLTDPAELGEAEPLTDPSGLPLPLFAQRDVGASGRDVKVYVVGERAWAVAKPWPVRSVQDKTGTPVPLPPDIRAAALACGRALGLELFGVDFVVAGDRFFVVDVNAFPGFRGAADLPRALAGYIYERALGRDPVISQAV